MYDNIDFRRKSPIVSVGIADGKRSNLRRTRCRKVAAVAYTIAFIYSFEMGNTTTKRHDGFNLRPRHKNLFGGIIPVLNNTGPNHFPMKIGKFQCSGTITTMMNIKSNACLFQGIDKIRKTTMLFVSPFLVRNIGFTKVCKNPLHSNSRQSGNFLDFFYRFGRRDIPDTTHARIGCNMNFDFTTRFYGFTRKHFRIAVRKNSRFNIIIQQFFGSFSCRMP